MKTDLEKSFGPLKQFPIDPVSEMEIKIAGWILFALSMALVGGLTWAVGCFLSIYVFSKIAG